MRLLKRHDDTDDAAVEDPPVAERPASEAPADVPESDRVPRREGTMPDHGGPAIPDARTTPAGSDVEDVGTEPTARTAPVEPAAGDTSRIAVVPERVATEDVVVAHWSIADVLIALVGAALVAIGVVVLVRTGVNSTWYRPTTSILDATHTPLLGVIEAGTGVALVLAAVGRLRFVTTIIGLAMAVAGVVAAIETSEWSRELAIEDWWAWTMAGVGLVVALLALAPRRGHVDRVVRTA
jgi:hypothetical protein